MNVNAIGPLNAAIDELIRLRDQALNPADWILEVWIDVWRRTAARVCWIVRMRMRRRRAIFSATLLSNDPCAAVILVRSLREQAAKISAAAAAILDLVLNRFSPRA